MQPEPQIVKLLVANGLRPAEARTLACWNEDDDELTQLDMENIAGLRQPEVSLAVCEMRRRGWLRQIAKRKPERGAPVKVYTLAIPMRDIVREIVAERTREIDQAQELTVQLLQAVA